MTQKTNRISGDSALRNAVSLDLSGAVAMPLQFDNSPLYLPDSLRRKPAALQSMDSAFFRLSPRATANGNTGQCISALYAPAPLGLWAIAALAGGQTSFKRIILDQPRYYGSFAIMWLRLRLKNERRLMGSDVMSPMMMRALRRSMVVADYFPLTIGDWLNLTKQTRSDIQKVQNACFWMDEHTTPAEITRFIG